MAVASEARSPPPIPSPGVAASASASVGSSWGVGPGLILGLSPNGVFVEL